MLQEGSVYTELKEIMVRAARAGGDILKKYFGTKDFRIEKKSMGADFVTDVDKKAQDAIIKIFSESVPHIPIIAEEKENVIEKNAFYVDPLDGTLNFIHGFPMIAVSIGYWENDKPTIGVVYNPLQNEMYWAIRGEGAYLNGRRISVSSTTSISKSILATGWPYDRSTLEDVVESVKNALKEAQEIRSLGSAALECCHVAQGIFDGYWEWGLSSWDLSAGVVILLEAGAIVTDRKGREFSLEKGEIVCATPAIHGALLSIINPEVKL